MIQMSSVSDRVLTITTEYIGPSSKNFLERQTRSHMGGLEFNAIDRTHLPELAKWVNTSAGLLIGKERSQELSDKILKL